MSEPLQIRQVAQYPRQEAAIPGTLLLMQMGEAGAPYGSITPADLVTSALATGGDLNLSAANSSLNFLFDQGAGAVTLAVTQGELLVTPSLRTSTLNATFVNSSGVVVNGDPVVTATQLAAVVAGSVTSFNFRTGDVQLELPDILRAGGAPTRDAHFAGWITAPSVWDTRANDDTVATTNWVHRAIHDTGVSSFMCRTGDVVLQTSDVNAAYAVPGSPFPTASNPALGDASNRIATTLFVDESMADLEDRLTSEIGEPDLSAYAKLASPAFTGLPTAPTANPGTTTGQLATTAFVQAAITAGTAGVSSFNTRTGAVTLLIGDITGAGGAPLASPALTGTPTAPTAAPATNTTQIATTQFVTAAISAIGAGVTSFNGRSGAVTLTTADVTGAGGAPIANPNFTGVPTAPTAAPATSNTQVATTAYVTAAIAAMGPGVSSFNSRTGAVTLINNDISAAGGALVASPTFTGVPAAPTAAPGTSSTQLATTAFVAAAIAAGTAGVTSFNTRTGAVTLTTADVTGAGGAPIASPNLTGVPTAPTAAQTSSDTTLATTAFVHAAITAGAGVTSFNSRTGAVTLSSADVSAAGGALLASPTFTGTPAAPTATAGTSTTQLATTAFVAAAVSGVVTSFNGRSGAVTLTGADITGAGGALLASPTFTGTPNAPTATTGTNNTQIATTAFVVAAAVGGIKSVHIQKFTTAGAFTYTPTAGMVNCIVEAVGGGAGGGGTTAAAGYAVSGGGGGAGAYSRSLLTAAQVGSSMAGVVGAAGAGATSATGTNGGASSLGSTVVVAPGGNGGGNGTSGTLGGPGPGGAAGTGDVTVPGAMGGYGGYVGNGTSAVAILSGSGGGSYFGSFTPGQMQTNATSNNGRAAQSYGSGGSGGISNNNTTSAAGGAGSAGCVVITEFCSQ